MYGCGCELQYPHENLLHCRCSHTAWVDVLPSKKTIVYLLLLLRIYSDVTRSHMNKDSSLRTLSNTYIFKFYSFILQHLSDKSFKSRCL